MTIENPRVSIITPSYNSAQYIEETIRSVRSQSYPNIEHIIIDGKSSDETISILNRYQESLSWLSERDEGQSDALNKGLRLSSGEVIGWLNADDTYNANAISDAVTFLSNNPNVGMTYANCHIIDGEGKIIDRFEPGAFDLKKQLTENIIPQPTIFVRRNILKELGFVRNDLHFVMDYDLWLRIGRKYLILKNGGWPANFRIAKGSKTTSNPRQFCIENLVVLKGFFDKIEMHDPLNDIYDQAFAMAHWRVAIACYREGDVQVGQEHLKKATIKHRLFEQGHRNAIHTIAHVIASDYDQATNQFADRLQIDLSEMNQLPPRFNSQIAGQVYAIRAFKSRSADGSGISLSDTFNCILNDPYWVRNRGFRSLFFEAILGNRIAERLRRIINVL